MKVATLICMAEGKINGDVEVFNINQEEGLAKAIDAWKNRIREHWDGDSELEVHSRIEEGIINDYCYGWEDYSFQLFWTEVQ